MTCHICGREINQAPSCECADEMERMQARIEILRQMALKFGEEGEKVAKERDELRAKNKAMGKALEKSLPILHGYAADNPKLYSYTSKSEQDPNGVHALIDEINALKLAREGGAKIMEAESGK